MEKDLFLEKLREDTKTTVDVTRRFCINQFPDSYLYTIMPNSWMIDQKDERLTEKEIGILQRWRQNKDRELLAEEVAELMVSENEVPAWANLSVVRVTTDHTVINIHCCRRFQKDSNELFRMQAPLPPYYQEGVHFDVNWRSGTGII